MNKEDFVLILLRFKKCLDDSGSSVASLLSPGLRITKKSLWHKTRTEGTPSVSCYDTISDHAARVFLGLSPSSMPLVPVCLERGAGALLFGEKGR